MGPDARLLPSGAARIGAAAVVLLLVLWRSAGLGWTMLFCAFAAVVVGVLRGALFRGARGGRRAAAVLAAHGTLALVLLAAGAAPWAWRSAAVASRLVAALPAGIRPPSAAALGTLAAQDLAANNPASAVAPLQQLVAVAPSARWYLDLGTALESEGQWGPATLAALDDARFLGAGGPALREAIGQWYLQAAPGRASLSLVAVAQLRAAAAARPAQSAYGSAAVQAGHLAVDFYGPGPWWVPQ